MRTLELTASAFGRALSKLSVPKREEFHAHQTFVLTSNVDRPGTNELDQKLEVMFDGLSRANAKHHNESWFRKGLGRMKPYLAGLSICGNTLSPAAALHPTSALAVGLVNSVVSVSPSHIPLHNDALNETLTSTLLLY